jgi:enoyl-CoA hydratase
MNAAVRANALRGLRPMASRFQPSTLPQIARSFSASARRSYEYIEVSEPRPGVGQGTAAPIASLTNNTNPLLPPPVTLNRPKALNALCTPLIAELNTALRAFQSSTTVSAVVITGSERAFAAGADIKEMAPLTFSEAYTTSFIESWSDLTTALKKPLIAAVSGHALGGGCELALMADILYCTPTANFGQPEIKLGTIPGAGGSQRLTRAVGKAKAMELILTGRSFSGDEAERWGVAARVFPSHEALMEGALKTAETIAGYSRVAVQAAKEVVNKSQDLPLRDGVEYERRVFHALFGSQDQKIGMKAFAEKKKAEWSNQ